MLKEPESPEESSTAVSEIERRYMHHSASYECSPFLLLLYRLSRREKKCEMRIGMPPSNITNSYNSGRVCCIFYRSVLVCGVHLPL